MPSDGKRVEGLAGEADAGFGITVNDKQGPNDVCGAAISRAISCPDFPEDSGSGLEGNRCRTISNPYDFVANSAGRDCGWASPPRCLIESERKTPAYAHVQGRSGHIHKAAARCNGGRGSRSEAYQHRASGRDAAVLCWGGSRTDVAESAFLE